MPDSKRAMAVRLRALLRTIVTYSGLSIFPEAHYTDGNPMVLTVKNLLYSFRGFSMSRGGILVPCLYLFYRVLYDRIPPQERKQPTVLIPSILFSLFMVFGYSYEAQGNWDLAIGILHGEWLQGIFIFAGYALFFPFAISVLYSAADRITGAVSGFSQPERIWKRIQCLLQARPFLTSFLFLILAYLPLLLLTQPGLFSGDTQSQAVQAFSELRNPGVHYLTQECLLSESVMINQHHSPAHTLLLHGFLILGIRASGTLNLGFFLYVTFQGLFLLSSLAYALAVLIQRKAVNPLGAIILLLYAALHPMVRNYLFLITKDVPYAASLLFVVAQGFLLIDGHAGKKQIVGMLLAAAGIILFRNEGRYVLLLSSAAIALFLPKVRKTAVTLFCFSLVFGFSVFHILYPALSFTPGSIREMLSIPFQQTARYVREYGNEVTEEERHALDSVFHYDMIAKWYNPNLSDGVKNQCRNDFSSKHLRQYFRVWASQFRKHPDAFLQATIHNYYQYFYPGNARFMRYSFSWSHQNAIRVQYALRKLDAVYLVPDAISTPQKFSDLLMEWVPSLPIFSALMTPAVYVWALLFLLFYAIRQKKRSAIALLMIPFAVLAVCLCGPANAYYGRYLFPVVVLLPFLIPMLLSPSHNSKK